MAAKGPQKGVPGAPKGARMEPKEWKKGAREATRAPKGESENEQKSLEGSAKIDMGGARGGEKDEKRALFNFMAIVREGSWRTIDPGRGKIAKVRSGRGGQ